MVRWRTLTLAGAAALLVAICGVTPAAALQGTECEGAEEPVRKANLGESERTLLCLLNVHRVANGRAVITHDPALLNAAHRHSRFMESTHQFAHEAIGDGTPQERATASGYPFPVGENIHYSGSSSVTPADIFAVFAASPAHNGNMLDPISPIDGTQIIYLTVGDGARVRAQLRGDDDADVRGRQHRRDRHRGRPLDESALRGGHRGS